MKSNPNGYKNVIPVLIFLVPLQLDTCNATHNMKISAAIITSALVASATAFDKWQRTSFTPLQSNPFQATDKPK